MSGLVLRGVRKGFGGVPVLRGVDLEVPAGQLCAVLGPSGCGKTTLLRVVAGFEHPDGGAVSVAGRVVAGPDGTLPPERRRIGVVPQEGALFPHLSVAGNVGFGLVGPVRGDGGARGTRGLARRAAQRTARVRELLDLVGLGGADDRMPAELSGGQQQRVALARALAPEPQVVLLDEPFGALDTGLRAALREDVRAALSAAGATGVLVTHDQQEALSVADLVAVMREGRIVQAAAPGELYTAPDDLGVATFVGEAVVLPAHVRDGCARTVLGELRVRRPGAGAASAGGTGQVVLRPEQLVLDRPGSGVPARVLGTTYFGHDILVQLELLDGNAAPGPGSVPGAGTLVSARGTGSVRVPDGAVVALQVVGDVSFYPAEDGDRAGTACGRAHGEQ